ncbi:MAG: hypothetical protein RL688_1044, partial [Actinomycetota bacterium]
SFVPPNITYDDPQARVAFFPTYPHLVRFVSWLLPGGDTFAALVLNLLLGAVFIVLVGLLTRSWFGDLIAQRVMILCAIFPGSFVLSFAYSEALLLTLAAACLLLLDRERWLWAGMTAMLATATRPNGVALIAACLVAAVMAGRAKKSWRPFIAPLLSHLVFLATNCGSTIMPMNREFGSVSKVRLGKKVQALDSRPFDALLRRSHNHYLPPQI